MKGYVLDYINENEFRKLERALKKYNMIAFKKLTFEYYPSLRNGNLVGEKVSENKKNGTESYELKLPLPDRSHGWFPDRHFSLQMPVRL